MKRGVAVAVLTLAACSSKSSSTSGDSTARRPRTIDGTDAPTGSSAPERKWRDKPWDGEKACDLEGIGYLARAKISEAQNTIGAIMRGAQQAYDRETMSEAITPDDAVALAHALCGSSSVIPLEVPRGDKYQPAHDEYLSDGDATRGWKCLRFEIQNPQYFQYRYTKGSGYVGPARGLPNPGPDGFEVAAVGDLDGDGRTSTFTMVGVVDPKLQTVKVSTQIYCDDPDE